MSIQTSKRIVGDGAVIKYCQNSNELYETATMGGGVAQSHSQQPDPFVSSRQPYISSMSKFHG